MRIFFDLFSRRRWSIAPVTFILVSGGSLFLHSASTHAEATRPILATAVAIKNVKLSMPMDLSEVATKGVMGLDKEDTKVQKAVVSQAKEYISLRRGKMKKARAAKWREKCDSEKSKDPSAANPYCLYELARTATSAASTPSRSASARRDARSEITAHLKASRFSKVKDHEYIDVVRAVSGLGGLNAVHQMGGQVVETKSCVPPSVASAIAYKLEEWFPEKEVVETAEKLYRKASSCGTDLPAAKASFRLGLIHIWQKKCEDIQSLMTKVESIPEASQYHARAKYWRYHCGLALDNKEQIAAAKEALLKEHFLSFHNLAVNGDDSSYVNQIIKNDTPSVAVRSLIRPDLNPLLRATEGLIRAGSEHLAAEMIDRSVTDLGGLEPEVRLYVAVLMNRIGEALPKFKVLSRLFSDVPRMVSDTTMRLYFPMWYYDLLKPKEDKIDPLLLLSLIRQESAFNADARSVVGARGLMQLMPSTARSIASVRTSKLYDPKTNIRIGTKYFLKRLNQFDGDVELTLAAYNAGIGRVNQWIKRYPTDNKMLFLDFIPFKETRDYVVFILRNYYWYVKLYGVETTSASVEGAKVNASETKTMAIMNANAGLAAGPTSQE